MKESITSVIVKSYWYLNKNQFTSKFLLNNFLNFWHLLSFFCFAFLKCFSLIFIIYCWHNSVFLLFSCQYNTNDLKKRIKTGVARQFCNQYIIFYNAYCRIGMMKPFIVIYEFAIKKRIIRKLYNSTQSSALFRKTTLV